MQIDGSKFLLTWPRSPLYTISLLLKFLQDVGEVTYAITCKELHQDGEEHHHAVVIYRKRVRARKNIFDFGNTGCNIKRLRNIGDIKRAVNYCKKDGVYQEVGEPDPRWQKMDKREKAYFALTHTNVECIDSGQFSFSELTKLQQIRNLWITDWPQFKKRKVLWFHGETGTGKTREAWETLIKEGYSVQNIWISSGKIDPFFNGYTGQKAAILDDFRPGFCRFELLLRLLDGYPVIVNVKGGYVQWCAETIIITAPTKPTQMYVNRETGQEWDNLDQLLRRITTIKEFLETEEWTQEADEFNPQ